MHHVIIRWDQIRCHSLCFFFWYRSIGLWCYAVKFVPMAWAGVLWWLKQDIFYMLVCDWFYVDYLDFCNWDSLWRWCWDWSLEKRFCTYFCNCSSCWRLLQLEWNTTQLFMLYSLSIVRNLYITIKYIASLKKKKEIKERTFWIVYYY